MVTLTLLNPQKGLSKALKPGTGTGEVGCLEQWHFEHESTIRIGRAPDNNVVLNDTLVSRYHLELRRTNQATPNGSWQLVNQGKNGTFLNGILVSQGLLVDGSLIQLAQGGPLLKFQVTTQVATATAQKSPQAAGDPAGSQAAASQPGCNHAGNPPQNLFCIYCGRPIKVQRTIRQYQVLRTLGQGGMGTTYLAWDQQQASAQKLGHPQGAALLVLKEMNADMTHVTKARELFEREAHTLQTLHHPGIPQFLDFFIENGNKYLAMELIHGQDLEKRINNQGPVAPSQAIEWMIQTCEVLNYIHSHEPSIIHRDIKPANLLVRNVDNRIVVLDFGAVKEIGTAPGTRIGAEGYSAPEQDRGRPLTQSDLYAIGPTLIFLLTGEPPLRFYRKRGQSYGFVLDSIPTLPRKLRSVIERVTQPQASDRYPSAKKLMQALKNCL